MCGLCGASPLALHGCHVLAFRTLVLTDCVAVCVGTQVERNTATEMGGGVYVGTPAHLDWQGGVVDANAAVSGGGVACVSTMTMHGAVLSHNTATDGGGVYLHQRPQDCGASAFSGLKLSNNTATRGGGGLFSSWQLSVPAASVAAVCVPNCTGCTHHNNAALCVRRWCCGLRLRGCNVP